MTTAKEDLAAHNRCPPCLRHAMNYAVGAYAAEGVLLAFKIRSEHRGDTIAKQTIIDDIRRADRDGTVDAYGPTHPEAMQ